MNGGDTSAMYKSDGGVDNVAFSSVSEDSRDVAPLHDKRRGRGVWCGVGVIAALIIAVVVLLVVVVLAVYFGHPDYNKEPQVATTTNTPAPEATTTTTTTSSGGGLPTDVRLPTHLRPDLYVLHLRPDIYQDDPADFRSQGSVEISVTAVQTTSTATLHYRALDINKAQIFVTRLDTNTALNVVGTRTDAAREFYHIDVSPAFEAGHEYKIRVMDFSGPIKNDLHGIYYSTYRNDDGQTRYLLASQLQSTDARKVFPCMDEPALKARFIVSMDVREGYTSMCNTIITSQTTEDDGWSRDYYAVTPPMSTYLLAFIVSDFLCKSNTTSNGKLVEVCARPTAIDQVDWALEIAVPMQEFFEEYHEYPYPLNRTIHIAVPDFAAGAMENWGLIIYHETALLFSEADSSAANRQRVAVVVAHELAHQWFGNLVTPEWWDDIWLNEGFASYMEYHCLSDQFPHWRMEDQFVIGALHRVFVPDSLATSHPIYQTVQHPAQIAEIFDSITYNKEAMANGRDINVTEIMARWILQMGYPVIHINYNQQTGLINATQQHFLLGNPTHAPSSPFNFQWLVPVSIHTSQDTNWTHVPKWLRTDTDSWSVAAGADWVVGNAREQYYYRVNYDRDHWQTLIDVLNNNHEAVHIKNRAQIIDDTLNLARAGWLSDPLQALTATNYLHQEDGYIPWVAAYRTFSFLRRLLVKSAATAHNIDMYIRNKVSGIYNTLGWGGEGSESSHVDHLQRVTILRLACESHIPHCEKESLRLWQQWRENVQAGRPNNISQNVRSVVYCTVMRQEPPVSADWEWAFERFKEANSANEQRRLLDSLACTSDTNKLARLLQIALDEQDIRRGDFHLVMRSVAANPNGKYLAWNFFNAHWDTIIDRFGTSAFTLSYIVDYLTYSFSEDWEIKQLEKFMESHPNQGSARMSFQQGLENSRNNRDWRMKNEDNFATWLEQNT